jgi:hypothetical protein
MAKATYSVVVIRKNREKDYFDFWTRGVKINASGEELHSDLVGFTETVEAKNKQEAASLIQRKYPGFTIDVGATHRLG